MLDTAFCTFALNALRFKACHRDDINDLASRNTQRRFEKGTLGDYLVCIQHRDMGIIIHISTLLDAYLAQYFPILFCFEG